ncbi:MAG: lipoprotein insertase outer membrane protein LolB [Gammaproteobacteria bacterium]|nr:lipoprotein insertase outer membrane protein LolB [Gammaproteobacteria bacterium]MBU1625560.1 lipoprotein insertase outer membrane protein LolB [Gammaproteobacteria bacterium]MBU1980820.1 lipoprotein insertase outer membrane protein LolB [Gammaproteobacteria bacterium]
MRSLVLASLLLSACATTPSVVQRPAAVDAPFVINGRIAIIQPARRDSAGLRWTHDAAADEMLLLSPLGQAVARITSNAQGVALEADGETHMAPDAETLTQELLGWQLPLSGLRYWIAALPAPSGEFHSEQDAQGRMSVLYQQGWTIRYTRYAGEARDALPLRLSLQREGMEVRVLIDEWEVQ